MDNEEFSSNDFSKALCMSRSNLHLKMKSITGESATKFIRKIRFNHACKLLLDPQILDFGDQFDGGLQLPVVFRHELQEARRLPAHGVCPQPHQGRREGGVVLLP